MDILILCKRQYTARDLLTDRYGRLYEIPESLARRGHRIRGLATSYRYRPNNKHVSPAGVHWQSVNLTPLALWHWRKAIRQLRSDRPDLIWGSSDALHCIAAIHLGRLLGIPVVLDLYDNYDHFKLTALPGVRKRYHQACRSASAVTAVSHTLASHIRDTITPNTSVEVVGNGVRTDLFRPLDKLECRRQLGLPIHSRIIGTAGAINADRGIDDLFRAFMALAEQDSDLYLAFAGPQDDTPSKYQHPRIINLGVLDWRQVPVLINSLDVAVVSNRDDSFGRYCFPLKLQEALACGVPICAAATGDVSFLFQDSPHVRYTPGNVEELCDRLKAKMTSKHDSDEVVVPDWMSIAVQFERILRKTL